MKGSNKEQKARPSPFLPRWATEGTIALRDTMAPKRLYEVEMASASDESPR